MSYTYICLILYSLQCALLHQDPEDATRTILVIRSLVPGGVADQDGRLLPGDRLVFVNDTNLEGSSLDYAVHVLKSTGYGPVLIGVAKPLPVSWRWAGSNPDSLVNRVTIRG